MTEQRGYRFFEWINDHVRLVVGTAIGAGIALALIGVALAPEGDPAFDPGGEIYDTLDRAEEVFTSSSAIRPTTFIVEDPGGGDVLNAAALLELKQNQEALRADAESQLHLVTTFDNDLGVEIDGIYSLADAVDAALPGGLEGASDADVKLALAEVLAPDSPTGSLRFTLSQLTTEQQGTVAGQTITVWTSPAFRSELRWDFDSFDPAAIEDDFGDETNLDAERWLRDAQVILRGEEANVTAIGVAMDAGLVNEEQTETSGPFIFFAVAIIVFIAGALLRSYWASMITGAALAIVMMAYSGFNALLGLKVESVLLILVVPIALISFGVDFFIHSSLRTREMQVEEGASRGRAYPMGETAIFRALLLAALSSAAAFLSNAASGIEAIIQFGVAAAVGLLVAYVILGLIAPKVLLAVEEGLGPAPHEPHKLHVFRRIGFVLAAFVAGIAVTATIVFPIAGIVLLPIYILLLIYLPYWVVRRRHRRAAAAGEEVVDEVRDVGQGFRFAGYMVHLLARWRVITLPVVAILAVFGLYGATQVQSAFELSDFFSPNTDFIKSLDKVEEHFQSSTGGDGFIYVEGDLTAPSTLVAMEEAIVDLDDSGVLLARNFDGELEVGNNGMDVVRIATASGPMRTAIAATGVEITDNDGDGLADTPEQVAAIYREASVGGVVNDEGLTVFRPDQVETFLYVGGDDVQATPLLITIPTITDSVIINDAWDALDAAAANLEPKLAGVDIALLSVSGGAITQEDGLNSFTQAMLVSLPVALVLTALLAIIIIRSVKYALVSLVPILLVVTWVYAFMWLVDYNINPITATIAAIAIGVGIDYATHFTVRFLEEYEGKHEPSRFPALRRAGEGTGGALALSALTSMAGFLVLATAPTPFFSTFGILTAVMIFFAATSALFVLPSLLIIVTPRHKGEEREHLEWEITKGEYQYRPHSRRTAVREGMDPVTVMEADSESQSTV